VQVHKTVFEEFVSHRSLIVLRWNYNPSVTDELCTGNRAVLPQSDLGFG